MGEKRGLKALQAWCRKVTEGYKNVRVTDMSMSWKDGLAFCAIIHHFRPDLVDFDSLTKDDILLNNRLAFTVAEQSLGIPALLDAEDMVRYSEPDKLSIATYVSQYYQFFEGRNRGTASNNLHTNKLSMKRPFADRAFVPQALPAKIAGGAAPRGFFKDDKCSVCNNRVFILERLMVDAKLYHRTCFVCNKCGFVLRPGAYAASDDAGRFECIECPRDEKERSPVSDDPSDLPQISTDDSQQNVIEEETKPISEESVGSSLKLSNSFINARKQFFEESLDKDSDLQPKEPAKEHLQQTEPPTPEVQVEESMKLSIDEGLVMTSKNIEADAKIENETEPLKLKPVELAKTDTTSETVETMETDEDLVTPVNKTSPSFDFPAVSKSITQDDTKTSEPPQLPTSKPPSSEEEIKTPTNETLAPKPDLPATAPPQKTPRKTKRLSMDISSLTATETSALTSTTSPSTSMRSMTSSSSTSNLPVICSMSASILSLKRDSSTSKDVVKKPGKLVLPPTELTSPERDRKLPLELKGTYQSPLSPGSKWKHRSANEEINKTGLTTPEKPKIPEKPLILTSSNYNSINKIPSVPITTTTTIDKQHDLTNETSTQDVIKSQPESLPNEQQDTAIEEDLNPFGDPEETESPPHKAPPAPPQEKEVKVEVKAKVKPARPPRPVTVIKEPPKIEPKPNRTSLPAPTRKKVEIEYPDDLNPFGDDDEDGDKTEVKGQEVTKEEYPDDLNPFGDDDEDTTEVSVNDKSSLQSTSTNSLSKIEDYDSKLNPFGDESDEEHTMDSYSLSKDSRLSLDYTHSSLPSTPRSSSRSSRMGTANRKKKPAPLPPSLQVEGRESHHSDVNISYKGSPSLSHRSLQGSIRGSPSSRKKAAPRPPVPALVPPGPPALASTPKKDKDTEEVVVNQDLKAQKEQNNKTMKELVTSSPDKSNENTFGYWKKKKRPAPSVPVPPRRQIKMIPVKEIQSELLEIEEKQQDLETQGRDLEMMIREYNQGDEDDAAVTVDEEELILQLFELVNQKNILFRRQAELMYIKRSQSLEQEQADIEYKYRIISSKPEKLKSESERKKEENLLQRLIEIVELRNEIVESMDMDRQRVQDEDMSIQTQMAQRQGQLQERLSPERSNPDPAAAEEVEVKKEKKKHKLKFIKRDKSKDPAKDKKVKEPKDKDKDKVKDSKDPKDPKTKDDKDSLWKFAKKDKKKA